MTLNRTTELWAGLDGPGSETYDEASDSTYCYAADITLKDPSSDEVVHQANSIRIHEWGGWTTPSDHTTGIEDSRWKHTSMST